MNDQPIVPLLRLCVALTFALTGLLAAPSTSMAQDRSSAQTVEELQRRLNEIELAMQAQIAALRRQIADLGGAPPPGAQPAASPTAQSAVVGVAA